MKKAIYMPIAALSALFFINSVHAEMYKWTDQQGETHYTQTPPPPDAKGKDIEADIKLSSGSATPAPVATAPAATDKPAEAAPAAGDASSNTEAQHHTFCDQQAAALKQLTNNSLVKWKDQQGEKFLTDADKQAKIKELENNLKTMCSPAMFKAPAATNNANPTPAGSAMPPAK